VVAIVLLGRLLGLPFLKKGFQPIIGEVLAGVFLGLFGLVALSPQIEAFSDMGILMLMLLAGLTTDYKSFRRHRKESVAIATGGVLMSMVLVFFPLYYINMTFLGLSPTTSFTSALFISAILSNTAIEVCAKIFMEEGLGDVKTVAIGASFVDDILAVFLIGVVSSTVLLGESPTPMDIALLTARVVFFLLLSFFLISYLVEKLFNRFLSSFVRKERYPLTATILLAFGLALIARPFGLHEVIGAYMAGLMIGKWGSQAGPMLKKQIVWEHLIKDIDPPLRAIFSPLFFGYIGLVFADMIKGSGVSGVVALLALVLLVFAIAGKLFGCGGVARRMGFSREDSWLIGSAMGGRGALELVLLLYGKNIGAITSDQFTGVVLATLGTIIVAPMLYSFVRKRASRKVPGEKAD